MVDRVDAVRTELSRRGAAADVPMRNPASPRAPRGVTLASNLGMAADAHEKTHAYRKLLFMATGSFVAMYVLMYMMVDAFSDVYPNINQLYMAAMMTAPMVIIELLLMRAMFPNRRANAIIVTAAALTLIASITLLRRQAGVTDTEFLRSMIPHHSAAVLMCERAPLKDAEIKELCREIISSQQAEIDWMKQKLAGR